MVNMNGFKDTISIKEFCEWKELENGFSTRQNQIMSCFLKNKNKAITTRIIALHIYNRNNLTNRNKVASILTTMKKNGIVKHKSPYWTLNYVNCTKDDGGEE